MQVYVDESERRSYLLAAAVVTVPAEPLRSTLRSLCRPGQRRLHFAKERDSRRRLILSAIVRLDLRVRVYVARSAEDRRAACLTALVADVAPMGVRRLFLEGREGMNHRDVLVLDAALRKHGVGGLQYRHLLPHEEPLLWVPDAAAWAVGAGGEWRRRVEPLLDEVVVLDP